MKGSPERARESARTAALVVGSNLPLVEIQIDVSDVNET
jgi:hypothetical protein